LKNQKTFKKEWKKFYYRS